MRSIVVLSRRQVLPNSLQPWRERLALRCDRACAFAAASATARRARCIAALARRGVARSHQGGSGVARPPSPPPPEAIAAALQDLEAQALAALFPDAAHGDGDGFRTPREAEEEALPEPLPPRLALPAPMEAQAGEEPFGLGGRLRASGAVRFSGVGWGRVRTFRSTARGRAGPYARVSAPHTPCGAGRSRLVGELALL